MPQKYVIKYHHHAIYKSDYKQFDEVYIVKEYLPMQHHFVQAKVLR